MRTVLRIALIALVLSVGASFAAPPETFPANGASISGHDGLSQQTATDLANLVGGTLNHSCTTSFLLGFNLVSAGQILGLPVLTAAGNYLIYLSITRCV